MKKIAVLMVCMTVCGAALFAQTEADFNTKVEGNGVVITKYRGKGRALTIPASIGGKAVTGINRSAFADNKSLTSVTIPEGVTSIGNSAFWGCIKLTSITIPSGVTSIDEETFSNCGLTSITIPSSVTSIGDSAFEACMFLTSITIPDSVTSIGNLVFSGCARLNSATRQNIERRFGSRVF
ncbi:MAG: leucine-rich repeat domain-containing protein [Spirochaetaceae bacterium]|nr:leucine-rich repeat domain-containing protein [Spirochaetaceae bacterium]